MPIEVISEIVPKNNGDFPVVGDTNFRGGYRSVADAAALAAIPAERRTEGMLVYQIDVDKFYKLAHDLTTWNEVPIGSGGTGSIVWTAAKTWAQVYAAVVSAGGIGTVFVPNDGVKEMTPAGGAHPTELAGIVFIGMRDLDGNIPTISIDSLGVGGFVLGTDPSIRSKDIFWNVYYQIGSGSNVSWEFDGGGFSAAVPIADAYMGPGAGAGVQLRLSNGAVFDGTNCSGALVSGIRGGAQVWLFSGATLGTHAIKNNAGIGPWPAAVVTKDASGVFVSGSFQGTFSPLTAVDIDAPHGNTASRPYSPAQGQQYFDTDLGTLIVWNGSAWVILTGTTGAADPNTMAFFGPSGGLTDNPDLLIRAVGTYGRPEIWDRRFNPGPSNTWAVFRQGAWQIDGDPMNAKGSGFVTYGSNAQNVGPDGTGGGMGFYTSHSWGTLQINGAGGGNTFYLVGSEDGTDDAPGFFPFKNINNPGYPCNPGLATCDDTAAVSSFIERLTGKAWFRELSADGVYNTPTLLLTGVLDPYGRPQIRDIRQGTLPAANAVWRQGAWQVDGDPQNIEGDGVVVYGKDPVSGLQDGANGAFARVKCDRFAIRLITGGVDVGYGFRVDLTEMYFKDNAGNETFNLNRLNGQMFIGAGVALHGSNAGVQMSSIVANRSQYRSNQYGANNSAPGIGSFKSRGATVGSLAGVVAGDPLFRITAVGVAPDNASIPLAAFITVQVPSAFVPAGQAFVPSEFEMQLVPLAGPINSRRAVFKVTSEGESQMLRGVRAGGANVTPATLDTGALRSCGSGSPEGVVTGKVGDLYTDTSGSAGSTLYVKESGVGNTGWSATGGVASSIITTVRSVTLPYDPTSPVYRTPVGNYFTDSASDVQVWHNATLLTYGVDYTAYYNGKFNPGYEQPLSVRDASSGIVLTTIVTSGTITIQWIERTLPITPSVGIARFMYDGLWWVRDTLNAWNISNPLTIPNTIYVSEPPAGYVLELWRMTKKVGGLTPHGKAGHGRRMLPYLRGPQVGTTENDRAMVLDTTHISNVAMHRWKFRVCWYNPSTRVRSLFANQLIVLCGSQSGDRHNSDPSAARARYSLWIEGT